MVEEARTHEFDAQVVAGIEVAMSSRPLIVCFVSTPVHRVECGKCRSNHIDVCIMLRCNYTRPVKKQSNTRHLATVYCSWVRFLAYRWIPAPSWVVFLVELSLLRATHYAPAQAQSFGHDAEFWGQPFLAQCFSSACFLLSGGGDGRRAGGHCAIEGEVGDEYVASSLSVGLRSRSSVHQ